MNWLEILLTAWLAGHIIIPPVLYISYGFVVAAVRHRDDKDNPAPRHVVVVDTLIAIPAMLLDGAYNALWLPALCLDPRPHYAFKMMKVKGAKFPFFELATERFSRYNEQPDAWVYHRWIARTVAPFLDNKDPKGWHIRKQLNE